jgi:hypothetical protein
MPCHHPQALIPARLIFVALGGAGGFLELFGLGLVVGHGIDSILLTACISQFRLNCQTGESMSDALTMRPIEVARIFLDLENPRHEPYEDEAQVIEYLCRYENIFPLAKDIAQNGLNPLELLAVIPEGDDEGGGKATYTVAEGNRRLCALKLLDDPDRAPPRLRKPFEDLNEQWESIDDLTCIVFPDRESVKMWLGRIHEGEQGGIGRKKWNADQTARHSGRTKNKVALAILDYAERQGFISAQERRGKLTTVQRYLVNPFVRESMGIDASNINDVSRNRPKEDFDLLLRKFLADLGTGYVNSRTNKDQHTAYARELGAVHGQSHERVLPVSLASPAGRSGPGGRPRPKKRKPRVVVPYEPEIMTALERLGGEKLPNLYTSICTVPLDAHTPLVSIGVWAFLESLSAKAGRTPLSDFLSFFSKQRLQTYGISTGKGDKAIAEALRRVSASGDVTKHDAVAALFNADQLVNDMETLKDLIIKCAEEALAKKP